MGGSIVALVLFSRRHHWVSVQDVSRSLHSEGQPGKRLPRHPLTESDTHKQAGACQRWDVSRDDASKTKSHMLSSPNNF